MKVTVLNNQSVFDLAVRYCGSALAAFPIAKLNGIAVTKQLVPGSEIEIPEWPSATDIVNYFEGKKHQPATGWSVKITLEELNEGISYWAVNNDFVVQ